MLVRDLVHLLMSRAEPDDEVVFVGHVSKADGVLSVFSHTWDADFGMVEREIDEDHNERKRNNFGTAYIHMGPDFVRDIAKILNEKPKDETKKKKRGRPRKK